MNSSPQHSQTDHPAVRIHPPILFLLIFIPALILTFLWPLGLGSHWLLRALGALALLGALSLVSAAILSFRRQGTSENPHRPSTALVREGPYRLTRNPMYLSMVLILIGLGLLLDSIWLLLAAPLDALLLTVLVIRYEEIYLENKFGKDYSEFKGSVRRWL